MGLNEQIREYVCENYIKPARQRGETEIRIRAGDVHSKMGLISRIPAVCSALKSKMEQRCEVEILKIEEQDIYGEFINVCCLKPPKEEEYESGVTPFKKLFEAFRLWCEVEDKYFLKDKQFGTWLTNHGFEKRDTYDTEGRKYAGRRGIRLAPEIDEKIKVMMFSKEKEDEYGNNKYKENRAAAKDIIRMISNKELTAPDYSAEAPPCGYGANFYITYRISGKKEPDVDKGPGIDEGTGFEELIVGGENESVEYKSSVLWSKNYTPELITESKSTELKLFGKEASKIIIARTIAGFLNTEGGHLIIGVKETKNLNKNEIIGIESEFPKLKDPCVDDYRRMIVDDIIRKYFDSDIYNHLGKYIKITFPQIEDKTLCRFQIKKSDTKVFLTINKEDHFYIRVDAETREIKGKQIIDYCIKHFNMTISN